MTGKPEANAVNHPFNVHSLKKKCESLAVIAVARQGHAQHASDFHSPM
jgi:hypothetical protein